MLIFTESHTHAHTQSLCVHHAVRLPLCRGGMPLEGSPLCFPISGCVGWEPVGRVSGSPCGREPAVSGHTCGPRIRPDRCTCPQSHSAGTQSPERCTDTADTTETRHPTNNSAEHTHTRVDEEAEIEKWTSVVAPVRNLLILAQWKRNVALTVTAFGVVYPPYTRHTAVRPHVVDTGTARSPDGTAPTPTRYCDTDTLHRQRETEMEREGLETE